MSLPLGGAAAGLATMMLAAGPSGVQIQPTGPRPAEPTPTPAPPGPVARTVDARVPPRPVPLPAASLAPTGAPATQRELGTATTLFVNFDGVDLKRCEISDSRLDCHWYNYEAPIPAFSGSIQTQVSILQAMRQDTADYGIRVTAARPPPDDNYTMVVYGGAEADFGALGSAPGGDCGDHFPNQIVFAHLSGELDTWVNGGATTALHEASHSWGLDHINAPLSIMHPAATNAPVTYRTGCTDVVQDTTLGPGEAACPEINALFCEDGNSQDTPAVLTHLFGPPYVDSLPPRITLIEPASGAYFQAPAQFDVVFEVDDDLHPQVYRMLAWLGDEAPEESSVLLKPGFSVNDLPVGEWEFHVVIADEAGNKGTLDFDIVVGLGPPPEPDDPGCACTTGPSGRPHRSWSWLFVGMPWLAAGAPRHRRTRGVRSRGGPHCGGR